MKSYRHTNSIETRKEMFIKRAKEIHGDFYRYDKYIFITSKIKGIITCPIHGDFEQTMAVHTKSSGCPKCAIENKKVSFDEFLKRAREIWGDAYEYDKESYNGMSDKIRIYCKKHNEWFYCTGDNHLHNTKPNGCPKCGFEKQLKSIRKPFEKFIEEAKKIHGDKYEYDKDTYVNAITKMKIYCKKHDYWFLQSPHIHLNGCGCPKCRYSKMEWNTEKELLKYNVNFVPQETFDWLRGISKTYQYLDFYLPDYNIAIECQGKQHFKPFYRFGGEEKFKKTIERDKRKKKLCEEHGITIYYINHNENISKKVSELIQILHI